MNAHKWSAAALGIFGLAVIGGGVIRYMSSPGGEKGLYFGLVMGGIALFAAVLAGLNRMFAARIAGWFAIALVILWFVFDLFKSLTASFTIGEPEVRKLIVLGLGVAAAFVISRPANK